MNKWRGVTDGEAPHTVGRCKGGVQHVRGPLQPPQYAETSENIQMHRGVWGHMGMYTPGGVQMYGVYECMRCANVQGHPDTPK